MTCPVSSPREPTVWQYSLPSIKGEGWAHIVIRSDGFFAAVSDWGNFAHGWWHHGHDDVREFFLRMDRDWDYFARKLTCECRERVDEDESVATLKREMLRARRDGNLTREKAAEDWENFESHGDDWEGLVRERWNFTGEPWEYAVYATSRAEWFVKKIGPRLVKAIREQLDAEAAIASRPLGRLE